MEEGEAFMDRDAGGPGAVVFARGKGGAIFNLFELVLPKRATVARAENSAALIQTDRFKLAIKPEFTGFNAVFPIAFQTA